MRKIADHVYWSPPGPPDRPSLCVVAGERATIWLDAGSSAAHTREFADFVAGEGVGAPTHVVLTHAHWDHVLGTSELGVPVVAHELTAGYLEPLAAIEWSDEGLEALVAAGAMRASWLEDVREELPEPRNVRIALADIVFREGLDFDLGDVRVQVRHVGGDHADDSSVMYVEPDGLLFLGDCLYEAPGGGYTREKLDPLVDAIRSFGAQLYVEGHNDEVLTQADLDEIVAEAIAKAA